MINKNLSGWWWNYLSPARFGKFVFKKRIVKKLFPTV